MESAPLIVAITTLESREDADSLACSLVDLSLAACVQVEGPITSHYRWAGKVEHATEFRLMIKSTQSAWPALKETR
jgi:periplasmic divalent cation tolerance protein